MMMRELQDALRSNLLTARRIFDSCNFVRDKSKGQNFIFDRNIAQKIVDLLQDANDCAEPVYVEIGPGPGALTLPMMQRRVKKYVLIEYDRQWAEFWEQLTDQFCNVNVICRDATKLEFASMELSHANVSSRHNRDVIYADAIISNLPYNVSTCLLNAFMRGQIKQMVLMFQKEVADRIRSKHASKDYGALSVLSQIFYDVECCMDLGTHSFSPPPKVKSSVLRFYRKSDICDVQFYHRYDAYFDLLKLCFSNRRQMLRRKIKDHALWRSFMDLGYDHNVRAEDICVEHYAQALQCAYKERGVDG